MLGDKIREIRKEKNKTLTEVAEEGQLSTSYISQVERNLIEPSLASLRKIAKVLDTPIYLFLAEDQRAEDYIVRKSERSLVAAESKSGSYEIASTLPSQNIYPNGLLVAFVVNPKSKDSEDFLTHPSDEIVIVIKGELYVEIGDIKTALKEGDSALIKGSTPHRFSNITEEIVTGYSFFSPPAWAKQKA